jgi:hypothetical protein
MTHKTSRILAIAIAGALVLGGPAAQAKPKAAKTKRIGVISIKVTGSTDTSICDSIWVDSVTIKGPAHSTKVRTATVAKVSSVVGSDAFCTVTYSHKNFSAGRYNATFTVKCADASAALCNPAALSLNGTAALSADASVAVTASNQIAPNAQVVFSKQIRIKKNSKGRLGTPALALTQLVG